MRPALVLGAAALGLPLAAALHPSFLDACSVDSVLQYLTCSRNLSPVCAAEVKKQAVEFCRDFLAVEPVSTLTVIATSTTSTTTTTDTTTTLLTTTLTTETSTTVATAKTFVNPPQPAKAKRAASTTCPSLARKNLLHHPASRLSRACSCLGVTSTATAPATTVTSTTIETLVLTSTDVSTATSVETVVSSTTTTSTAVTTFTLRPQCINLLLSGIFTAGAGNQFNAGVQVSSVQECCALCYDTLNCLGAGFAIDGNWRYLLLKVDPKAGTGSSARCPLGFGFAAGLAPPLPGAVEGAFPGPCKSGPP